MNTPLVLRLWNHPLPALSVIATAVVILAWPAIPLRGLENWFLVFVNTPYIRFLYPIVAVLSGTYVGLFVYHKRVAPCCSAENAKVGAAGSFVGIFLGVCPACIPTLAILLPITLNVFLSRVAPVFSAAAIAILLFAIHRMRGFSRLA